VSSSFQFIPSTQEEIQSITNRRDGEQKLGETLSIQTVNADTKVILLGIEESIGAQANFGLSGAENAFSAFLKRFVNMQDNSFQRGKGITYIGRVQQRAPFESVAQARLLTAELDELVTSILNPYAKEKYKLLIIGGGHNNAYPILKAMSNNGESPLDVINLDPHADCRKEEGRHSGNSFSSAHDDGYLNTYSVIGLHKAYNSSYLFEKLEQMGARTTFFEDYLLNESDFKYDVEQEKKLLSNKAHGIELDLDAIQNIASSAYTPSGISTAAARWFIRTLNQENTRYLHLTESAPMTTEDEKTVGKLLAYLASDFIQTCD
jgi:formiminoglutamase